MQHHLFPTMSWFIVFLTITFVHAPSSAFANDDERYVSCSNSFDCGDIKGVGYPFWGSNRPDYCGYPQLKLHCSDQDLEITIEKLTYKVLGIDNQTRTLSVARTDYAENICPTLILNTTWIPSLLNYTSDDQNITIYYGCPTQGAPTSTALPQFPCNINATEMTGYFTAFANLSDLGSSSSNLTSYLASCKDSIKVPVRESAFQQILSAPTAAQLLGGLNQGFGLKWNASHNFCDTCQSSGGKCGYNQSTTAFTCYCKDQPQQFSCQQSPTDAQSPTNDQSSSMSSCLLLFFFR
ncbi:LEAF RUST 10 DISEASE-RESISTANCE LOCUS RECEPTOR-LIKE PROTEIN KINASE-like 2.1 [Populus nigra]|uniref:LEAF RUST 10 DISEASE-RESISTANCE LOCUS RECEPTOR-LIKE PROTEIN KINASE-like 2.1 n=1 Tax=Populus nigra TaxID=3691 RepID=UPI002B26BF9B|nr:LEAF RUST 10 DISEASE-RESISTANCE LOCUS RECEPTOR-LIKE PROTEIN KINASE-like 2.1 [Populus nigra]